MGSESIASEAEGRWAIESEAMRAKGIIVLGKNIKIQLVSQTY